jgi:flagellar basal body-associated protein FliL
MHYFDYIRRFINSYFKHKYKEEIKDKEFKKQLFKDLKKIKNDIINNTTTCDRKVSKLVGRK